MKNLSHRPADFSESTRTALEVVAGYFERQILPEICDGSEDRALEDILIATRHSLSCLALAAELTVTDQAVLLNLYSPAHPEWNASECLDRVSELLIEVGVNLARSRIGAALASAEDFEGNLPDHERLRRGDLVRVQTADPEHIWQGRLATFVEYTDPRIGHHQRLAALHLNGELPTMRVLVRPQELEFHVEEQLDIERYEHLGAWSRDGFRLELYDTTQVDLRGKAILAYELHDETFGPEPVFSGSDFHCSPLNAVDSLATVASLLSFLGLRPGDTDAEHFSEYTLAQLEWCQERGEELSWVAEEYRQLHEWKLVHHEGSTADVLRLIARSGRPEDVCAVLETDISEAYDTVGELASSTGDPDLAVLHQRLLPFLSTAKEAKEGLVEIWMKLGYAVPWIHLADPPFGRHSFIFCRDLEDLVTNLLAEERHTLGSAFALDDFCCICLSESGEEEWLVIRGRKSLGNLPVRARDEDGNLDWKGTVTDVWEMLRAEPAEGLAP